MSKYNHTSVEKKWQDKWESVKIYVADIKEGKNPFLQSMDVSLPIS